MTNRAYQGTNGPRVPRELDEKLKNDTKATLDSKRRELGEAVRRLSHCYAIFVREMAYIGRSSILDDEVEQLSNIATLEGEVRKYERTLEGFNT